MAAVRIEYAGTDPQRAGGDGAGRGGREGAAVERIFRKPDAGQSGGFGRLRLLDTLLGCQSAVQTHAEAGELLQGSPSRAHAPFSLDVARPRPGITGRKMGVDHAPLSVFLSEDHRRA